MMLLSLKMTVQLLLVKFIGEGTLPRPYGDEGSYLWIKDGEPAWTGEGDGPVPGPDPVEIKKPTVLSPAPGNIGIGGDLVCTYSTNENYSGLIAAGGVNVMEPTGDRR